MAYSFFGTFSTGQWEAFKAFTQIQKVELSLRLLWLQKELVKIGVFETKYGNDFLPVSFSATPGSYADKLLRAYRILGGNPEKEMLLRTSDDPVYLISGSNFQNQNGNVTGGYSDVFSNGRVYRGGQRFDRDLGLQIEAMKSWQLESIKLKREHLEYKIKRALDYSDQIQNEVAQINTLLSDGTGSVDDQILQVELAMSVPGAANVVDNPDDPFGLFIGGVPDYTYADADQVAQQDDQRDG